MKKAISVLLTALILTGLLSSCSKQPSELPSSNLVSHDAADYVYPSIDMKEGTPLSMTADEIKKLNVFISNFAETGLTEYSEKTTDETLINFAITHTLYNSKSNFSIVSLTGAEAVISVDGAYIKDTVKKFFGREIENKSCYENLIKYEGGRYSFKMDSFDETYSFVFNEFAQVDKVMKQSDGSYNLTFSTHYFFGENTVGIPEEAYGSKENWSSELKGQINSNIKIVKYFANIKPVKSVNDDSWQLVTCGTFLDKKEKTPAALDKDAVVKPLPPVSGGKTLYTIERDPHDWKLPTRYGLINEKGEFVASPDDYINARLIYDKKTLKYACMQSSTASYYDIFKPDGSLYASIAGIYLYEVNSHPDLINIDSKIIDLSGMKTLLPPWVSFETIEPHKMLMYANVHVGNSIIGRLCYNFEDGTRTLTDGLLGYSGMPIAEYTDTGGYYKDAQGNRIGDKSFAQVYPFRGDFAFVSDKSFEGKKTLGGEFYFIDRNIEKVSDETYFSIESLYITDKEFFAVRNSDDTQTALLDMNLNTVIPFTECSEIINGENILGLKTTKGLSAYDSTGTLLKDFPLNYTGNYSYFNLSYTDSRYITLTHTTDYGNDMPTKRGLVYDVLNDKILFELDNELYSCGDGLFVSYEDGGGVYYNTEGKPLYGSCPGELVGDYLFTQKGIYQGYIDLDGNWLYREKNYGWYLE